MTAQLVGYHLVDSEGEVIQRWGGTWGQQPGIPNPLILPNGDQVLGATLGWTNGAYALIAWEMEEPVRRLQLTEIAAAKLDVVDGELIGIERGHGIVGGFAFDDTAYVYFEIEEVDTDYIVIPPEGIVKFTDHVEVTRSGLLAFSFLIQRVQ